MPDADKEEVLAREFNRPSYQGGGIIQEEIPGPIM